jgi:hypothetical protein
MSTYTDLKNTIKETVVVNYTDRATSQEVKFLNENNEYWGTFKGTTTLDSSEIVNSTLKNVKIIGADLEDVNIGPINLSEVQTIVEDTNNLANGLKLSVEQLSKSSFATIDELSTTIQSNHTYTQEKFNEVDTSIVNLDTKIDNTKTELDDKIDNTKTELVTTITELGTELTNKIDTDINTAVENINNKIDTNTTIIIDKIDAVDDRLDNVNIAINNKVDLSVETLCNTIVDLSVTSDKNLIENKHYKLLNDSERYALNNHYPHKLLDYAVNAFTPVIFSQYAEDPSGKIIAGIYVDINGNTVFKTFDLMDSVVNPYLIPAKEYTFKPGQSTYYYSINGYEYELQKTVNGYSILRASKSINYIKDNFGTNCGIVTNAAFDNNKKFISGDITLDLDLYNSIQNTRLSGDELSVEVNGTIVQYIDQNKLALSSGATSISARPLIDNNINFATVYGADGFKYDANNHISSITLTFDGVLSGYDAVTLNNQGNDKIYLNDELHLFVNAEFNEDNTTIAVQQDTKRYIFNAAFLKSDGSTTIKIPVIPNIYNENEWKNVLTVSNISVDLNTILPATLGKVYVLTPDAVLLNTWTCEQTIENYPYSTTIKLNISNGTLSIHVQIVNNDQWVTDNKTTEYTIVCDIEDTAVTIVGDNQTKVLYKTTLTSYEYTDIYQKFEHETTLNIIPAAEILTGVQYDLITSDATDEGIVIEMPDYINNDAETLAKYAQEFTVVIKPINPENLTKANELEYITLKFVNAKCTTATGSVHAYEEARIVNNDRGHEIDVVVGQYTTLSFKQIGFNESPIYFANDLDETTQDVVIDKLIKLTNTHTDQISVIQDNLDILNTLSATVDSLVAEVSAETLEQAKTYSDEISTALSNEITALSTALSGEIDTLSIALSNEITALSTSLSNEITALSTALSGEIDTLSIALSNEIDTLSTSLSNEITALSTALSNEIDTLSIALSNEIDTLSTSLSNEITALSTALSNEITALSTSLSNTVDVLIDNTLSTTKDYTDNLVLDLSTALSNEITALSTSLSNTVDVLIDNTLSTTKDYTDNLVLDLSTALSNELSTTKVVVATNTYHIDTLSTKHDSQVDAINKLITDTSAATLADAKTYSNELSSSLSTTVTTLTEATSAATLADAKTYSNELSSSLSTTVAALVARTSVETLSAANSKLGSQLRSIDFYLDGNGLNLSVDYIGENEQGLFSIDVQQFIKDTYVKEAYIDDNKNLVLAFNGEADPVSIPLTSFIDTYIEGPGITIKDKIVSVNYPALDDHYVELSNYDNDQDIVNTKINDVSAKFNNYIPINGDRIFGPDGNNTGLIGETQLSGSLTICGNIIESTGFNEESIEAPHKIKMTNAEFNNLSADNINFGTLNVNEKITTNTIETDNIKINSLSNLTSLVQLDAENLSFGELVNKYNELVTILKSLV